MKITRIIGIVLCLMLAFALVLSFTACKEDNKNDPTPTPDPAPVVDKDITGVTFVDATFTYDGTEKKVEVTGTLPEGVTATYTNNTATNAGAYNAKVVLAGEGYKTLELTARLVINKADITGVSASDLTVTYDGTEKEILLEGTVPAGVTVDVQGNKATNAGNYTATFTLTGDNYNTKTVTAALIINKADITGVTLDSVTVTYDGSEVKLAVEGTLPEGVTVEYTGNSATEVGTYPVVAVLSGDNYNTLELTAYIVIEALPEDKDITGVTLEDATFTYDGTAKSLAVVGTLPEGVSVEYNGNGKTDAGTYTVTAVLSGEGYKTLTITAELKINKATITGITLEGNTFTYDGTAKSIAYVGTLPEGVTAEYTGNGATAVGDHEVTLTLSGSNYETLVLKATIKITKAQITGITFMDGTYTYQEGVYHSLAISGTLPEGVTVEYTGNGVTNAGTYTVTATISGEGYETLVLTATLTVKATTGSGVLTPPHDFTK